MAISTTKLSDVLSNLLALMPFSVTIGGSSYSGTRTVLRREKEYLAEGVRNAYRFSVIFAKADFDTVPEVRSLVTVEGAEYRILNIQEDGSGTSLRLDVGDKYAG